MDWVKLRTHVIDHPRFLEVGTAARDLWTWGMLYSGEHELDGKLPMVSVMTSAWGRGDRANVKLASTLVEAGLWERTENGYLILRWSEQGNLTKAQLSADREAARSRKKTKGSPELLPNESRTSEKVPTSTSNSLSCSDLPEGESAREGAEDVTGIKPSMVRYREAYVAGVTAGKGSPWAWPPMPGAKYADQDLGLAISTFAKSRSTGQGLRGDKLTGWIAAAAEDFVRHVLEAEDDPKFWSNFAPKGLVRFLNQDVMSEEARRVG
jgi:hypothetical protein